MTFQCGIGIHTCVVYYKGKYLTSIGSCIIQVLYCSTAKYIFTFTVTTDTLYRHTPVLGGIVRNFFESYVYVQFGQSKNNIFLKSE